MSKVSAGAAAFRDLKACVLYVEIDGYVHRTSLDDLRVVRCRDAKPFKELARLRRCMLRASAATRLALASSLLAKPGKQPGSAVGWTEAAQAWPYTMQSALWGRLYDHLAAPPDDVGRLATRGLRVARLNWLDQARDFDRRRRRRSNGLRDQEGR